MASGAGGEQTLTWRGVTYSLPPEKGLVTVAGPWGPKGTKLFRRQVGETPEHMVQRIEEDAQDAEVRDAYSHEFIMCAVRRSYGVAK